jgi:hypothetical protein
MAGVTVGPGPVSSLFAHTTGRAVAAAAAVVVVVAAAAAAVAAAAVVAVAVETLRTLSDWAQIIIIGRRLNITQTGTVT